MWYLDNRDFACKNKSLSYKWDFIFKRKSIFSNKDYSFIKGLGFVTSTSYCINDIYYDRGTLEEISENEELKNIYQQMDDEIYLSDSIIKNDLLRVK